MITEGVLYPGTTIPVMVMDKVKVNERYTGGLIDGIRLSKDVFSVGQLLTLHDIQKDPRGYYAHTSDRLLDYISLDHVDFVSRDV